MNYLLFFCLFLLINITINAIILYRVNKIKEGLKMSIAKEIVDEYVAGKKVSKENYRWLLLAVDEEDGCINFDLYDTYKTGLGEDHDAPNNEIY